MKNTKEKYVVQSSNCGNPYYLAGRSGDPGRTFFIENAKVFNSEKSAQRAINKTIKENPHRNFGNNFSIQKI